MKGTVRIIAGNIKGKAIPFNPANFKNADITPQKVKGALFSIIGENLSGMIFLDLFSGSGQVGVEALSRNCDLAVFVEKDRKRFEFIRDFIDQNGLGGRSLVLNKSTEAALKLIPERGIKADFVFLDPPYDKIKGETSLYDRLLGQLLQSGILKDGTGVIVQHYSANTLPESCGALQRSDIKKYGTTSLSVYHLM